MRGVCVFSRYHNLYILLRVCIFVSGDSRRQHDTQPKDNPKTKTMKTKKMEVKK